MAAKRKITLADIQGPGDKAQIDARGSVRPARERIRPGRFQPAKDLLDFRGLSQTIRLAAGVLSQELNRRDERNGPGGIVERSADLGKHAERRQEMHEDMTAQDGRPLRFLDDPPPDGIELGEGSQGLASLPTDQPGLSGLPGDVDLPGTEPIREEIGAGLRSGAVSPRDSLTTSMTVSEMSGEASARALYKTIDSQVNALTKGSFSGKKFVPNLPLEVATSEAYNQIIAADPTLDPNSSEADDRKIALFLDKFAELQQDLRKRVKKGLDEAANQAFKESTLKGVYAILDSAMDPTTFARGLDLTEDATQQTIDQAASGSSDVMARARDGSAGDINAVSDAGILGYAEVINKADLSPGEKEERLLFLQAVGAKVQRGLDKAINSPFYRTNIDSKLSVMIRNNQKTTAGDNPGGLYWNRFIADSPALARIGQAIRDGNHGELSKIEKEHEAYLVSIAAKRHLTGHKLLNFMARGRSFLQDATEPFDIDSFRLAKSYFARDSVLRKAYTEGVQVAKDEANMLYNNRVLQHAEWEGLGDELTKIELAEAELFGDPNFKTAISDMEGDMKTLKGLGLTVKELGDLTEQGSDAMLILKDQASKVFHAAESRLDGRNEVGREFRGGALGTLKAELRKPILDRIRVAEEAQKEAAAWAQEGHHPTEEEWSEAEQRGGAAKIGPLVEKARRAVSWGVVMDQDTSTGKAHHRIKGIISSKVQNYLDQQSNPVGAIDDTWKRREHARIVGVITEQFEGQTKNALDEQAAGRSRDWKRELSAEFKKIGDELITTIPTVHKDKGLDEHMNQVLEESRGFISARAKGFKNPTEYEAAQVKFISETTAISPQLKDMGIAKSWAKHQRAKLFGGESNWDKELSETLSRIDNLPLVSNDLRQQLRYEILTLSGDVTITDLLGEGLVSLPEGTPRVVTIDVPRLKDISLSQDQFDATGAKILGKFRGKTGEPLSLASSKFTFDLSKLKLRPQLLHVKSKEELLDFTSDDEKFAVLSEALGFGKWKLGDDPGLDEKVDAWKKAQLGLLKNQPR